MFYSHSHADPVFTTSNRKVRRGTKATKRGGQRNRQQPTTKDKLQRVRKRNRHNRTQERKENRRTKLVEQQHATLDSIRQPNDCRQQHQRRLRIQPVYYPPSSQYSLNYWKRLWAKKKSTTNRRIGENASPEYSEDGVKDLRVGLFFALVRGAPKKRIESMMDKLLFVRDHCKHPKVKPEGIVADLFLMGMQTRNCRGGKGERDLFYTMLLHLNKYYPQTVKEMIRLVPHFGSYKDWFELATLARDEKLVGSVLSMTAQQLEEDRTNSVVGGHVSLLAKWAPREKRKFDALVDPLSCLMFPTSKCPKKEYRKLVSSLNKISLRTTETKMADHEWDRIKFASVPSKCLMKYRLAFLNEKVGLLPSPAEAETGNRHPSDPKRVACRKQLREVLLADVNKLKGRQLFPHEITQKLRNKRLSSIQTDLLEAQWKDIVKSAKEAMEEQTKEADEGGSRQVSATLGKLVPLVDVSGSMTGMPMEVAIALGILVSELNDHSFRNHFLTFESRPNWVSFEDGMSLAAKVRKTACAPWGGSTNVVAALEKILRVAKRHGLSPNDIPNLIVFSDMQFDCARSSMEPWETQHERLVRRFAEVGSQVCGKPWPVPHIVYWNLRGNTNGFPAQSDTEGVTMLSGYSPALLKLLLAGEELGSEVISTTVTKEDGEEVVVVTKKKKDPYDTVRAALDDAAYDKVREVLDRSMEGELRDYTFDPEEEA